MSEKFGPKGPKKAFFFSRFFFRKLSVNSQKFLVDSHIDSILREKVIGTGFRAIRVMVGSVQRGSFSVRTPKSAFSLSQNHI